MIVYIACLSLGLLFTIMSAIMGHFLGGHGGHPGDIDAGGHPAGGSDQNGGSGISFFSPTVLACFVTAFGACGIILSRIDATKSAWISAPAAAVTGFVIALIAFSALNFMFKHTQSSSESRVASLIGHSASIVTPIPANGVGEIAYVQGGARYTAPARTESGNPVATGKPVKITRIVGTQYFVERII